MQPFYAKLTSWLILSYFLALIAGFYLIQWQQFSVLSFLAVLYVSLFIADFIGGLAHLFIDYQPLNYAKHYDELYFYPGDRNTPDFADKKRQIVENSSRLDMSVYHFKVHHRNVSPYLNRRYASFFYETVVPSAMLLVTALVLATRSEQNALSVYLAFALLIISVGVLHTNHVHSWVHGSKTMPWGVAAIKVLQKMRLMYSMETHARHHSQGESGFCFLIGHANFIVDPLCRLLLQWHIIHKRHWHGQP